MEDAGGWLETCLSGCCDSYGLVDGCGVSHVLGRKDGVRREGISCMQASAPELWMAWLGTAQQLSIAAQNGVEGMPRCQVMLTVNAPPSRAPQVCVIALQKGKLRVMSSAWDRNLGGFDFDTVIVNHFVDEIKATKKLDVRTNPRAMLRLRTACEKVRCLALLHLRGSCLHSSTQALVPPTHLLSTTVE